MNKINNLTLQENVTADSRAAGTRTAAATLTAAVANWIGDAVSLTAIAAS